LTARPLPVDIAAENCDLVPAALARLREEARRALSSHARWVTAIRVRLQEPVEGGPPRCFVTVEMAPAGGLAVAAVAATVYSAFDTALMRAVAALRHELAVRNGESAGSDGMRAYIRWDRLSA
jgi:hypothetical protein